MFKDWCELNGWYDSEPPPEAPEEGADPAPVEPKWLAKGKALAAFRSAIAGNEELENLVYGFQLSEEEAKEPNVILKHLQEHFMASEGVLMERTKFAQMKQEDQESVTAWEGRVKEQGRRLEYCNKCEDQLLRDKFISGINNERLMSKLLDKGHRDKTTKEIVSFKTMLQVAKNFEQCEKAKALMQQAKGPTEQVNYTGTKSPSKSEQNWGQGNYRGTKTPPKSEQNGSQDLSNRQGKTGTCQYCAGPPHPRSECPASNKRCSRKGCGRIGHFARACRMGAPPLPSSTQAHHLDATLRENYETDLFEVDIKPEKYAQSVYSTSQNPHATVVGRKFFSYLKLGVTRDLTKSIRVQLDTASTCNTLPERLAQSLIPRGQKITNYLTPSTATLFTYDNSKLTPMGKLELLAETTAGYHLLTFHVLRDAHIQGKPPLLSGSDCVKLGLVKIRADEIHSFGTSPGTATHQKPHPEPPVQLPTPENSHTRDMPILPDTIPAPRMFDEPRPNISLPSRPAKMTLEWVLEAFPDVHTGLGQFGKPVSFDLDPTVTPVHDAIHRQPVARHAKIKEQLDKMESEGKICRQYEPTAWCSNMTIRETKDKFRICLDPSNTINKAIRVPKHPIPRFEDILPQLNGAKCFSVADAMSGFTNILLDHESNLATTFHTPFGRYRWLRLPYGVSSGPEEYQARQQEALAGLEGICNIADDVLIYGCGQTKEEAEKDHDKNLYNFLLRMQQVKLKLNPTKWRFKTQKVIFMGFQLSPEGVSPAPSMSEAIVNMPKPQDPHAVQRYLGMLNFLARFCPKLSDVVKPLRELTHKDVTFQWTDSHDKAFVESKELIAHAPVLCYFNPQLPVTLQVDASGVGVGGALLQNDQPVAFYSNTLTETEQRYAVIEKECLAICLAFEKWDSLLYGKSDITVQTDHQPLESIFKKPLNKAPRRLQAMRMRLQRWSFEVKYKKGAQQVIADTLSRAPLPHLSTANLSGEQIFRVELEAMALDNSGISKVTQENLQEQTAMDPALQKLSLLIMTGWPTVKTSVDPLVRPYFTFKDELSVADGIVYKGEQAVIPSSMRPAMLEKIHKTHFGVGSCIRRAKVSLFWPGMTSDIKNKCTSCPLCAQYASQAPKEPMLSHDIPDRPWSVVSQDILMWEGKWHLVTTCHYSDWVEIDVLPNTLTATVVQLTKAHFARFGIPERLITDNGPQFISSEYKQFASEYAFEHVTSSPYWPQGNGKAEAAVKIVKRMYQKNKDIHLALLDYRNTPQQGQEHSPAQRLLSRRTKGILPMTSVLLQPEVAHPVAVKTEIGARRTRAKQYYDRNLGGKAHEEIQPGQWVYAKPNPQHKHSAWPHGIVQRVSSPRSYTVVTPSGGEMRRNRTQIRLAAAPPPDAKTYMSQQPSASYEDDQPLGQPLLTIGGPMTPPPKQRQPPPQDSKGPRQTHCPVPAVQNRHTDSRLHRTIQQQRASDVPSVNSEAESTNTPDNELRTRSGRVVRAPVRLDL